MKPSLVKSQSIVSNNTETNKLLKLIEGINENTYPPYFDPYREQLEELANQKDPQNNYILNMQQKTNLLNKTTKQSFKDLSRVFSQSPAISFTDLIKIFFDTVTIPKDIVSYLSVIAGLIELFTDITEQSKKEFVSWSEISAAILTNCAEESQTSEFELPNNYIYKPTPALASSLNNTAEVHSSNLVAKDCGKGADSGEPLQTEL
eukprot:TRINITY_DN10363_c0_g1_i2.p1 TRINITY_DN10363_c0_g1~~TRINITY_DN10363_c0_g1_i2.p1  ORF type:complete len:205 (-),score=19.76 TRINITY_DN10363_c0_g1_i2:260-874(-)